MNVIERVINEEVITGLLHPSKPEIFGMYGPEVFFYGDTEQGLYSRV